MWLTIKFSQTKLPNEIKIEHKYNENKVYNLLLIKSFCEGVEKKTRSIKTEEKKELQIAN